MAQSRSVVEFRSYSRYLIAPFCHAPSLSMQTDANPKLCIWQVFGPLLRTTPPRPFPSMALLAISTWEFLGKSSSEAGKGDLAVKLDFGLSHAMLSEEFRKAWPHEFGLVYSVTLTKDALRTSLQVTKRARRTLNSRSCCTPTWPWRYGFFPFVPHQLARI